MALELDKMTRLQIGSAFDRHNHVTGITIVGDIAHLARDLD